MYEHLDRFPIRNGLAVGSSSLIGQFTSNAAASGITSPTTTAAVCPAAVVVDKLVGVRLDGRGANSVTYPTMLTIGSNSKLFGAQYEPSSMKRFIIDYCIRVSRNDVDTVVKCQNLRLCFFKKSPYCI